MSVIINPNSGPGTALIPAYVSLRSALHAAGISVFGYVATGYGAHAISRLEADIDAWKSYYQPDGIFLDEMAYVSGAEPYDTSLTRYAKANGVSQVIGNPGTDTIPSYVNTVDAIIVHESNGIPGPTELVGWHMTYGPQHFGIVSSEVAQAPSSAQLAALQSYISLMYITSEPAPPRYQKLPPYFEQLLSNLAQS
jgi:hypothetical protein